MAFHVHRTKAVRRRRCELKAFRATRLPGMPAINSAGFSTKPWGSRGIRGIGISGPPDGPSKPALDAWTRATRVGKIRKPRSTFINTGRI